MLRRLIFLSFPFFFNLHAFDPADPGDLFGDPSIYIEGCVNVINGSFIPSESDLELNCPEPLHFRRYYHSGNQEQKDMGVGFWHNHPLNKAEVKKGKSNLITLFADSRQGNRSKYCGNGSHRLFLSLSQFNAKSANTCSGHLSGKTHLKNSYALWDKKSSTFTVHDGDGSIRYFSSNRRLIKERLPSGNIIRFTKGKYLDRIIIKDSQDKICLGWVDLCRDSRDRITSAKTSDGKSAHYGYVRKKVAIYDKHKNKTYLKEKQSLLVNQTISGKPPYSYGYRKDKEKIKIDKEKYKINRTRLVNIRKDGKMHLSCSYSGDRVSHLYMPGTQSGILAYRFSYNGASTAVIDALGAKFVYRHKDGIITEKEHFLPNQEKTPYRKELFYWEMRGKEADLAAKALADSKGNIYSAQTFAYDARGNVVHETFIGNLTGKEELRSIAIGQKGTIDLERYESCSRNYSYSNDGFNLVLSEADQDGKLVSYRYVPNTDKVSAILTSIDGKIVKREFFTYNSFMVPVQHIEDDGSSGDPDQFHDTATSRMTLFHLSEIPGTNGFGKPLEVIEGYRDPSSGECVQLKRIVYTYGRYHLVASETHFDAEDRQIYSLVFEYDASGNCVRETDRMGIATIRKFDKGNLCTFSKREGSGLITTFGYDYADRLSIRTETHESGEVFKTRYRYDDKGNLIEEIDPFGNSKKLTYDPFGRLVKVQYPEIKTYDGSIAVPEAFQEFDIYDRVVKETDPEGNVVAKSYNSRGQILKIVYPDGSFEGYLYNLNGTLRRKYEKNGARNEMYYDRQQRLVREETYSSDGVFQRSKEYVYQSGLLFYEIDAGGIKTEYTYDPAGRKVARLVHGETGIKKETYHYDPQGRVSETRLWLSEREYLSTIQEFDNFDRVIEQRAEDQQGRILSLSLYSYDINGNRILETVFQNADTSSTTQTEYTSFNLPLKIIDPLGNETNYRYIFNHQNPLRQNVMQTVVVDPLGRKTTSTKDSFGRECRTIKENAAGRLLASESLFYDCNGNRVCHQSDAVVNGRVERQHRVVWNYDAMNRVAAIIEGPSNQAKETRLSYHPMGMTASKQKPDGVIIAYTYDDLGRVIEAASSDGTVSYTFQYDLNDRLVNSIDRLTGDAVDRSYDSFGNLVKEALSHGAVFEYQHDLLNRLTKVVLPDQSSIVYSYDFSGMVSVARISAQGNELYSHTYLETDWQGRSLKSLLITGNEVSFDWDLKGRAAAISSGHFSESVPRGGYDCAGNLLRADFINNGSAYSNTFEYDGLNQVKFESTILTHRYTSDSLHNRIAKDGNFYQINSLNQLMRFEKSEYLYDPNGNLIFEHQDGGAVAYGYDAMNRLVSIEKARHWKIEYGYDSFGRRIRSRHYLWGEEWELTETRDYLFQGIYEIGFQNSSGKIQQMKVMGKREGALFRACIAFELEGRAFAPLYDHRFNVCGLVDLETGLQAASYRYSAFGEVEREGMPSPWLFGNQRYEEQADLYHFGKRDFRPGIGRWTSPDPGDFADGWNLYAYAKNSPTVNIDFYGYAASSVSKQSTSYRNVVRQAWKPLETAAHHLLLPTPQKLAIEGIGRILEGGPFWDPGKASVSGVVNEGNTIDGVRVRYIPGVLNDEKCAIEMARRISEYLGDAEVHYTCQVSQGFLTDLMVCCLEYMNVKTPAIQHLSDQLMSDYEQLAEVYADSFREVLFSHSRGGLDFSASTKDMPQEIRQVMEIFAFGSAKLFYESDYKKAKNYVNDKDIVNIAALATCKDPNQCNLIYTGYQSDSFFSFILDHFMDSDGYQLILKQECETILNIH